MVSCVLLEMEFGGYITSRGCTNRTEAKYNVLQAKYKSLQYIFQL